MTFDAQGSRSGSRHQLELIRRYSRILREETAREKRRARKKVARSALDVVRPPKPAS